MEEKAVAKINTLEKYTYTKAKKEHRRVALITLSRSFTTVATVLQKQIKASTQTSAEKVTKPAAFMRVAVSKIVLIDITKVTSGSTSRM